MLGLGSSLAKGGASLLTFVKDNLKLYLDFKSNKSDTLKFPSEGSTSFDGSSNYIETSDSADFDFGTGNFSISFWFNVDDINWNWAVSRVNTANNADVYRGGTNNGGKLIFRDIAGSSDIIGSTTISANVWNHYTAVRNNGTLKLYLNGVEDASASSSGNFDSDKGFRIGRWQSSGDYWDGQLTNVAVWSRALTPEEIQSIMNKSYSQLKGVEKTSLVSWWALDSQSDGLVQPATGEVLGNEISGDPTFDNASNWSVSLGNGGVDVNTTVSGKLSVVNAQDTRLYKYSILTVGKLYKVTFVVDSYSSGRVRGLLDNAITFTPTGAGTYTRYFVASNTFFLVSFDGTANMTMTDISIKEVTSNTGVVTGATTTTSVYGGNAPILPRAVDVAKEGQADAIGNGSLTTSSGGYADLGNDSLIQFGGSFSVSCWFKTTDTTSTNEMVIAKADDGVSAGWLIRLNSSRKLDFVYTNSASGGVGVTINDTGSVVNDGEWYHVAFVHESGVGNRAYKNGILIGSNSTGTDLGSHTPNLHVGSQDYSSARALDGSFAQVGLWQGALTQSQIQSVMESTSYLKIPADVKSTLGSELITNGTFDSDISGWGKSNISNTPDVTYNNGKARIAYSSSGNTINIGINTTNNPFNGLSGIVKVTGNIQIISGSISSGAFFQVYETNTANNVSVTPDSNGDFTAYIKVGTNNQLGIYVSADVCTFEVDNISAKLVSNDLVAYYPLDGSSEVKGLNFDGTNDYIQLPVPFSNTNHSISVWANHSGTNDVIFSAQDSSSDGIRLFIDDGNRLLYTINNSSALVSTSYPNQWVHYVCTYDGSTMRVYANGVEVKDVATEKTVSTTTNARIGATSFEAGGYFEGSIRSVALYSTTKSASEVLGIYNNGINGNESSNSGLVGYYKMNNASIVSDLSSNSNDGTVNGATLISAGTTDSVGNNDGGLL